MRPSSVCMPVAKTSASASPPMQVVPLKTRSRASRSGPALSANSAERYTGCDSPVSVDMSTSSAPSSRRASAETRSPSSITITSPGTSCTASTDGRRPSRSTVACCGRYPCSASTARSACRSWTNAKTALRTMTATIAIAERRHPRDEGERGGDPEQQRERDG